jgi:RNA polymerase sigma factor (sigma-70 family)
LQNDDTKLRLYLAHRAALIDYATPIVGCRVRAEDVVQEAYLRFAPARAAGGVLDQPLGYLYRIVRNLAFDLRRSLSADSRRDQAHAVLTEPAATAPSAEEIALFRDDLRRVDLALAELPENTRRAFEMHRLGGYTFQQIADHLGVSLATAARWSKEAFIHLARRLDSPSE